MDIHHSRTQQQQGEVVVVVQEEEEQEVQEEEQGRYSYNTSHCFRKIFHLHSETAVHK